MTSRSAHSHRRTAAKAAENVTTAFPGHAPPPKRFDFGSDAYNNATTLGNPNRHGCARSTAFSHQPRAVSRPR